MALNSFALNTTALNTQGAAVSFFSVKVTVQVNPVAYFYRTFITNLVTQDYSHSFDITNEIIRQITSFSVGVTVSVTDTSSFSVGVTQDVVIIYNPDGSVNNNPPSGVYDPYALQDLSTIYPLGGYIPPVASSGQDSYAWSLILLVGGIDVSHMVVGSVTVNKEANQAAVCAFVLHDVDLTQAAVNSWNQQTVEAYFEVEGSSTKVFYGGIAGFVFDPIAGTFSFSASDNLQSVVQNMYDAGSLAPPSGYSFRDLNKPTGASGWDWLQEAASSVPLDYGLNLAGSLVFYSWETGVPGAVFTDSEIVDGSLSLELQDKNQIINYIEVSVTESSKSVGESTGKTAARFVQDNVSTVVSIVSCQNSLNAYGVKKSIMSATVSADYANSLSLWTLTKRVVSDLGTKSVYLDSAEMASLVLGSFGEDELSAKLVCPTDIVGANDPYVAAVKGFYQSTGVYDSVITYNKTIEYETADPCSSSNVTSPTRTWYFPPASVSIKDADALALSGNHAEAALVRQEKIALAEKTIKQSHRGTVTSFSILCSPSLTWGHSVKIDVANLTVSGRVSSVTHSFDVAKGQALSSVSLKTMDSGRPEGNAPDIVISNNLPADTVNCSTDGSFDLLTNSSTSSTYFNKVSVHIPFTGIQIGQY